MIVVMFACELWSLNRGQLCAIKSDVECFWLVGWIEITCSKDLRVMELCGRGEAVVLNCLQGKGPSGRVRRGDRAVTELQHFVFEDGISRRDVLGGTVTPHLCHLPPNLLSAVHERVYLGDLDSPDAVEQPLVHASVPAARVAQGNGRCR